MQRFPIVPLATFAIAVLLASLVPSSRHLVRAAGEATGCTVQAVINGKATSETVTEGKDTIHDNDKKSLRKAIDQGFKKLKVDTSGEDVSKSLDDTVDEVFARPFDAITVTLSSSGIDGIAKTANVWTVTGTFDINIVVVLPKNADATLTNHELGHKLIAEKTVDYAKKKIKEEVEKAPCDEAAIRAAFDKGAAAALAVQEKANQDYDDKTDHGKKGGAAGQIPQATASFAAAVVAAP
jgi:CheY-like chemotaxis protein